MASSRAPPLDASAYYARDIQFWRSYTDRLRTGAAPPDGGAGGIGAGPPLDPEFSGGSGGGPLDAFFFNSSGPGSSGQGSARHTAGGGSGGYSAALLPPHARAAGAAVIAQLLPGAQQQQHQQPWEAAGGGAGAAGAHAHATSERHFEAHRRLIELARLRQDVGGQLTALDDRCAALHERKAAQQARVLAALNARVQAVGAALDGQRAELLDYLRAVDSVSQARVLTPLLLPSLSRLLARGGVCLGGRPALPLPPRLTP
jgi:uncharacterized coiled-coil protein SlyX